MDRDAKTLVLAGPDRVVRVWDFANDKELHRLTGHDDEIVSRDKSVLSFREGLAKQTLDTVALHSPADLP